ncbi:glycosyltransferase [Methylobacterium sp. D54C]
MSTEFAISRFFVPLLASADGENNDWALFCDCDFLWLGDVKELIAEADASKALCCVQHQYAPKEELKMDGQAQLLYLRKNWSSLMLFNLKNEKNFNLNIDMLNALPGRDLHRFCWLADEDLHPLSKDWNWLEGSYPVVSPPPRAVHFTRGGPWMRGWEGVDYGNLWRDERRALEQINGCDE